MQNVGATGPGGSSWSDWAAGAPAEEPATSNPQRPGHNTPDPFGSMPQRPVQASTGDNAPRGNARFIGHTGTGGLLTSLAATAVFYDVRGLNPAYVSPDIAARIYDMQPVVVFDTSIFMKDLAPENVDEASARLVKQKNEGLQLLDMLDALCQHRPNVYTLNATRISSDSRSRLHILRAMNKAAGAPTLTGTLEKIRADLIKEPRGTDVALYLFTGSLPPDGHHRIASRWSFESRLIELMRGIPVIDANGVTHRRQVSIALRYLGNDNADFHYQTPYDDSSHEAAERTSITRLAEVRAHGSTAAYYRALCDARTGGIERLTFNKDPALEIEKAQLAGYQISTEDVALKNMVGMLSPRPSTEEEPVS
ncbi:hypothetical protein LJR230_004542 [Trinickia sp. LjRoot230]|uniref:hypothetical protein n=1 Tax=Trinickia sp. LjRoot230 TaxID=3342288 RepID=UPI003ECFC2D9